MAYPVWSYFPSYVRAPDWVTDLAAVVGASSDAISTLEQTRGLKSDGVLAALAPGMEQLGYLVETGKAAAQKIRRPVLFGENGVPTVSYEVDAVHDELGIVVEVEAGRAARGNAAYRDLIRTSLILDARFLVLMLPVTYRYQSAGRTASVHVYKESLDQLRAIFASQRLTLPFKGVLLLGY